VLSSNLNNLIQGAFPTSSIGDNGSMSFWDWKTGYQYQSLETTAQPGSLDAEAGLMSSTFDKTGLRLICGEADKTSKGTPQPTTGTVLTDFSSQSMEAR
jgi:hypothetical protein